MRVLNELQQAELRSAFRQLYHNKGFNICLDFLAQALMTAELMAEVLSEELQNGNSKRP